MTSKHHKIFIVLVIVSLFSLVGQLCILPVLPDMIPIHWNVAGEIDNYGSRWLTLLFGALPLLLLGLFRMILKVNPKGENNQKYADVYALVAILFTILFVAVGWIVSLTALEVPVPVERILPGMIGAVFIILGCYMPRIRPNHILGIRTSWTLASETVWKKTHRVSGICCILFGLVMILHAIFPTMWLAMLSMLLIIGSVIFLSFYSWLAWKKEQK